MLNSYNERTATAFHEAGHTVAAVMVGFWVRSVDIVQVPGGRDGRTSVDQAPVAGAPHFLDRQVYFGLAGLVGEFGYCHRVGAKGDLIGQIGDFTKVTALLEEAGIYDRNLQAQTAIVSRRLEAPSVWSRVEVVARSLLASERLGGQAVASLTGGLPRLGPSDFLEDAEYLRHFEAGAR